MTNLDWETVKSLPQPRPLMNVDGTTWQIVDEIEMHNQASEASHLFTIKDAKSACRMRSKQRYPDGTSVEDTGHVQLEGSFELTLLNIAAGRPVMILHRTDYIVGNYELEISVNGKKIGQVPCVGADRTHRWRNWPIPIAAEHVTGGTMRVRLTSLTANRDIHMYHVWVYQPK